MINLSQALPKFCLLVVHTDEKREYWKNLRAEVQGLRQLPTLQAPGLQDQPVLSDYLQVLATKRLPQPHLHLQLAPSGLPSI